MAREVAAARDTVRPSLGDIVGHQARESRNDLLDGHPVGTIATTGATGTRRPSDTRHPSHEVGSVVIRSKLTMSFTYARAASGSVSACGVGTRLA
jgi:hypothetical protein